MSEDIQQQLTEAHAKLKAAQDRIHRELIDRTLRQAAEAAGAYNPSVLAHQLRAEVRTNEKGEDYVLCIDDSGVHSPAGMIQKWKDDPANAYLFKGLTPPPAEPKQETVDIAKLDHETYRRLRSESPEKLGLSSRYVKTGRRS